MRNREGDHAAVVGLVVNPMAGRDIRRLTAGASLVSNREKVAVARRVVAGLLAAHVRTVLLVPDDAGLSGQIVGSASAARVTVLDHPPVADADGASRAVRHLVDEGATAIVAIGGDGTVRAAAAGCADVPLVAVSTGTNNVVPTMVEGTLAGLAAAAVAQSRLPLSRAAVRNARIEVHAGDRTEVALVDVAACRTPFTGSRAIWDADQLLALVLARAQAASVGLSSIGGALHPLRPGDPRGLFVTIGHGGKTVDAVLAPGLVAAVPVLDWRTIEPDETITLPPGGSLALDGEREIVPRLGVTPTARLHTDGPWLVDVKATLEYLAAPGVGPDATDGAG